MLLSMLRICWLKVIVRSFQPTGIRCFWRSRHERCRRVWPSLSRSTSLRTQFVLLRWHDPGDDVGFAVPFDYLALNYLAKDSWIAGVAASPYRIAQDEVVGFCG